MKSCSRSRRARRLGRTARWRSPRAHAFDGHIDRGLFVHRQVVEDHGVAGAQRWHEHLLEVGAMWVIDQPAYAVTFSLSGFAVVRREGVALNAGFTAPVNAQMRVGSLRRNLSTCAAPTGPCNATVTVDVIPERNSQFEEPKHDSIGHRGGSPPRLTRNPGLPRTLAGLGRPVQCPPARAGSVPQHIGVLLTFGFVG